MKSDCGGIFINTISGGIVNFGGAFKIAPVSITNNTASSTPSSSGTLSTGHPTASETSYAGNASGSLGSILSTL